MNTLPEVRHNESAHRFESQVDGLVAHLDYDRDDDVLHCYHTEVPPPLEGRGIASALMRAVVAYADANALRVYPACSYVRTWMKRHPDTARLLPEGLTL